jgi:2-polyprenyl-6-methoxyphenol hydroxylase-like FAD-dependent oxidoreductase
MRVLISGAGIAGPTLAYWLTHYGIETTLVERAPKLRTGGYIIDFWGLGFEVAGRMGLMPELQGDGYRVREVRVVDRSGRRVSGFPAEALSRATGGGYVSLPRGDLAAAIYRSIEHDVEVIFGDSIVQIEQSATTARVAFEKTSERNFDLVIGADGLHSRTRQLAFGSDEQFEIYLGYKAAAFEVQGYRPRDEMAYVMYTEVGQQVSRFAMRGDRTMFLFTFADQQSGGDENDEQSQKALLHQRFGSSGWECPRILAALDDAHDLYFDRVSQIRMKPKDGLWARGRVMLLGDAAFCVSLLAGQGSALAMAAAYILAGELHIAGGDYASAFRRYQEIFAPFVAAKQTAALQFGSTFAPKSEFSLFVRNQLMKLLRVPVVANIAFGRTLKDNLSLPQY